MEGCFLCVIYKNSRKRQPPVTVTSYMNEHAIAYYTFRKKDQAITLGTKSVAKVNGGSVHVVPQLFL